VCVNDVMAIGAIDEATSRSLRVPADLSVAGFDGIPAGTWDRYRLTTMRQPLPQLAEAAVDTISRKLADPARAHEKRLLLCTFAEGASTAAPADGEARDAPASLPGR
jgi:DNA-binding LacI/PurR family transcriptional regulator